VSPQGVVVRERFINEAVSMEHAREIDLIELAAGRLEAGREKIVLAHVESCPACRTKLQDIRRTWDLLGAWHVQTAGHADSAGRRASSAAQEERRVPFLVRFPGVRMAARIAAVVAVSVLIGYVGGRWSVRPTPTGAGMEPPPYVSVLGFELGDSFSSLVLQEELAPSQES
jgi:anti-sigma factor RsiW